MSTIFMFTSNKFDCEISVNTILVGRWAEQNVDPALFSRELMRKASTFVGDEEVLLS